MHFEEIQPYMERVAAALEVTSGGSAFASAYNERLDIRKRWPGLGSGSAVNEEFHVMCAAMGDEPDFEEIQEFFQKYGIDRADFTLEDLQKYAGADAVSASAWIYFGRIGLIISHERKGFYRLRCGEIRPPIILTEEPKPAGKDYW